MPRATDGRCCAVEASRGALLAAHAACGLAAGHFREGVRLLRAAEGLLRAAVAALSAPEVAPAPAPAGGSAAPRRRRRRRGRGGKGGASAPLGAPDARGGGLAHAAAVEAVESGGMAIGESSDEFNDAWADALPPRQTGPGKGKDKSMGTPTTSPDVRVRLIRGPLEGLEAVVASVGDSTAQIRLLDDKGVQAGIPGAAGSGGRWWPWGTVGRLAALRCRAAAPPHLPLIVVAFGAPFSVLF